MAAPPVDPSAAWALAENILSLYDVGGHATGSLLSRDLLQRRVAHWASAEPGLRWWAKGSLYLSHLIPNIV